jgi:hypothetical protein
VRVEATASSRTSVSLIYSPVRFSATGRLSFHFQLIAHPHRWAGGRMRRRPTPRLPRYSREQGRPPNHPRTAMARRRYFHGSTSLARSKFELTVPFFVDTQRRELTGRYNRRKLVRPGIPETSSSESSLELLDAFAWLTDRSGSRPPVRIQLPRAAKLAAVPTGESPVRGDAQMPL